VKAIEENGLGEVGFFFPLLITKHVFVGEMTQEPNICYTKNILELIVQN